MGDPRVPEHAHAGERLCWAPYGACCDIAAFSRDCGLSSLPRVAALRSGHPHRGVKNAVWEEVRR